MKDKQLLDTILETAKDNHHVLFESLIHNITSDKPSKMEIDKLISQCMEQTVTSDKKPMGEWIISVVEILDKNKNNKINKNEFEKAVKEKLDVFSKKQPRNDEIFTQEQIRNSGPK